MNFLKRLFGKRKKKDSFDASAFTDSRSYARDNRRPRGSQSLRGAFGPPGYTSSSFKPIRLSPSPPAPGTLFALKGKSYDEFIEAGLPCPECSSSIVVLVPPSPIPGRRAQIFGEHKCAKCAAYLYTTTHPDGCSYVGTGYHSVAGGISLENGLQLEFGGPLDADFEATAQRLEITPLVAGPGPDGMPKLYRPEELA